jgi:pectin methylesterase-like acyl-CoA thioesterase
LILTDGFMKAFVICAVLGFSAGFGWAPVYAASPDAAGSARLSPSAGAANVCPDTPLRLTFPAAVTLGTGTIEIRSADDDALLDSIPVSAPGGGAPGRGAAPGGAPTAAPAPVAGVSSIRTPVQVLPRQPLAPGLPTRARIIGGTGFITYPVMIFGQEVTIVPAAALPYNKAIYVKIPAGTLKVGGTDDPGLTDAKAWRFTTKAAPPAADAKRLTVAADGSGDFCTVQGAVDFVPAANTKPITFFIREGVYCELVNFSGKNNLTFLGEDRKKTIVAYPNNNNFSGSTPTMPSAARGAGGGSGISSRRGLFNAQRVSDLVVANLTLHNTTAQGGSQAEAIILSGTTSARAILTNVDLYSFQDTLQINGQAYLSHCYIEGDVDFMWGTGPCFFEDCRATTVRNNAYYTQIRNTAANHGYVYKDCLFDGAPGITGNVLSRIDPTRFPASEVVLLDCTLTSAVSDAAWRFDGTNPAAGSTHFWEYRSRTPAGDPVDTSKRFAASRRLTEAADAELIKNYADPQWVLGGWSPQLAPIITAQPAAVTCAVGQKATFSVGVAAIPDATYQWQKDGGDIPGATQPTYTIAAAAAGDAGRYTVIVANAAGQATSTPAALTLTQTRL